MRRLKLPPKNNINENIELWDKIVNCKQSERRSRLKKKRSFILNRYTHYQANTQSLENITPHVPELNETIADDLRSCYGENAVFREARKELFSVVLDSNDRVCQYCRLNHSDTIDHYFDKGNYPEYSVFLPNLIPCCDECNRKKGSITFNANHERQFVHFYFDAIPDYQFLFVHLSIDAHDNLPKVSVTLEFHNGERSRPLIESHFERLGLIKKYEEMIRVKLSVVRETIRSGKKDGCSIDDIRHLITYVHNGYLENYCCNYWVVCMYQGILNSPGFIEQLYNNL